MVHAILQTLIGIPIVALTLACVAIYGYLTSELGYRVMKYDQAQRDADLAPTGIAIGFLIQFVAASIIYLSYFVGTLLF